MRTPRSAAEALAYLTECQMATLETLKDRKSTSKSDLRRHEIITQTALGACMGYVSRENAEYMTCLRLLRRLP